MFYPISGLILNPIILVIVGFVAGLLSGFFGVGGGFIATPLLFIAGMPMNIAVGTDLTHMTGKSIVAARQHKLLGNVDVKLGFTMVAGTIIGVESGAQLLESLKRIGYIDQVIGVFYIFIMLLISTFMFIESFHSIRKNIKDETSTVFVNRISSWIKSINIPPMISFPVSGIEKISIWTIILIGFITGFLAGSLGVGGGFIRLPLLVYFLGIPTHIAIGTDLFEIIFSASFGTFSHALKGNVDILVAITMNTGAVIGARIGALGSNFVIGPKIRFLFAFLPLIGALLIISQLL
jgi:uncharacterized membrane protein YfcA